MILYLFPVSKDFLPGFGSGMELALSNIQLALARTLAQEIY